MKAKLDQEGFDRLYNLFTRDNSSQTKAAVEEILSQADLSDVKLPPKFEQPTIRSNSFHTVDGEIVAKPPSDAPKVKPDLFREGSGPMKVKGGPENLDTKWVGKTGKFTQDAADNKATLEMANKLKEEAAEAANKVRQVTKSAIPEAGESLAKKALKGGGKRAFSALGGPAVGLLAAAASGDIYAADPSGSEEAGRGSDLIPGSSERSSPDRSWEERAAEFSRNAINKLGGRDLIQKGGVDLTGEKKRWEAIDPINLRPLDISAGEKEKPMELEPLDIPVPEKANKQDVKFFDGKSPGQVDSELRGMGFKIDQPEELEEDPKYKKSKTRRFSALGE